MTLVFSRNFDEERETGVVPVNCGCDKPTKEEVDALLEAAKAEAYQSGLDDGYNNAVGTFYAEADQIQAATLAEIKSQLGNIYAKSDQHQNALEAQVLDFSMSICEQVFPYLEQSQSDERALQQIKNTMRLALDSPYITVAVSEPALPRLKPFIDEITTGLGITERVKLVANEDLENGATTVEWHNGFMEYNFNKVCAQILNAIKVAQKSIPTSLINGSEESV